MTNMTSDEKGFAFEEFLNSTFDGLNPEKIVFLMTVPNPDSAVAAKATVAGGSTLLPISGEIGYCFEYPAATTGESYKSYFVNTNAKQLKRN
jgi:hypothetical protein